MDYTTERREMVETQLRKRGIRDERVLAAFLEIPRQEFIPFENRAQSYADAPDGIGFGQTISQPYMTALMTECLQLRGHEVVLDVGTGSGYHAAVLAKLARRIVSIEIIPELAAVARENLSRTGYGANVLVVCGDGCAGYAPESPYDAISVAAAAPEVPYQLLDQLGDPGVLVIPVGGRDDQDLRVVTRRDGKMHTRVATCCRFVPLRGRQGWK